MIDTDSPGYMIPPGSVWNDIHDRLSVCFEIHDPDEKTPVYMIELIVIRHHPETGRKLLEFVHIPWPKIKLSIEKGQMQRCPSLEPKLFTKRAKQ